MYLVGFELHIIRGVIAKGHQIYRWIAMGRGGRSYLCSPRADAGSWRFGERRTVLINLCVYSLN